MRKKTGRRVFQKLAAAVALICTLVGTSLGSMTAQADSIIGNTPTKGSITLTKTDDAGNPLKDSQFTLYKIMDLTPGENAGEYANYSAVTRYAGVLSEISPDELGNYSAAEIEALVDKLLPLTNGDVNSKPMPGTNDSGKATLGDLELGYYMVVETITPEGYVAGAPFFIAIPSTNNYDDATNVGTEWVYDVEFIAKNSEVPLEKKLKDGEEWVNAKTASIGDIIDYRVKTTIPDYADEYFMTSDSLIFRLTDTFSTGLSFNDDIKVYVTDKLGVTSEVPSSDSVPAPDSPTWSRTLTSTGYVLTFAKEFIKEYRGCEIEVTYSAEVTEDAVIGYDGNKNKVVLDFSNNPQNICQYDTKDDDTTVYTFAVKVEKFAGTDSLAGAIFALYKDAACTEQVLGNLTTDASGIITFERVAAGTYYLKEIQAPEGYKLLTNPIKVQIVATTDTTTGELDGKFELYVDGTKITATEGIRITRYDATAGISTIAVENHEGFTLPKTGGMGIFALLIAGLGGIAILSIVMIKKRLKE